MLSKKMGTLKKKKKNGETVCFLISNTWDTSFIVNNVGKMEKQSR